LLERCPPQLSGSISGIQQRISDCLRKVRDIAFTLSPHLAGEEIERAFTRLCTHICTTFNVKCEFESRLDRNVADDGVAFHLFRIAQEACTNAVRHASPDRIVVRLSTGAENVLEISDDGKGVTHDDKSDLPGMGISMMKFRARAIGGSLRVLPGKPSGTLVRCRFENKHAPAVEQPQATETCSTCI
ncbi:MAG: sensor histidine kinase, partial [Chthoniobacterales bacterium]